ncbi:MAG: extracellular solute-binding protein [Cellulosilyticum sp.]|nr:extracellular solute-binding protein [Cellulosilyticum sp.]
MKKNKVLCLMLAGMTSLSLAGCGGSSEATNTAATPESTTEVKSVDDMLEKEVVTEEKEGYTFGEGVTFHSDEPVTYSMMFSDHENYPYKEDWRLWSAIQERTNVTFDLTLIARSDYEDKKSVLVNSGDAPYIIPKTYEEGKYVNGGQVVAVSDWVKYMPNYQRCMEEWGMADDLKMKLQADGKYYVLPGLWEGAGAGYSYIIRKDIFEAAGVDVETLQKDWNYDDFYEALKKVKEHTGSEYVWSDASKGDSSLNIAAIQYGVTCGWGIGNGLKFDQEKEAFYFADTTDNYKEFVSYFNKMINEGILDPESFSQEDDAAKAKFFTGESFVLNGNYQNLADYTTQMQVDGAELYMVTAPGGPVGNLQVENSRLENGIMIAQNALDDLGEEEFIKMLRFVDWLWYSEEGQMLSLWGVEGETYTMDGDKVVLNPEITYNGINPDAAKKLNADYGFAGGVFAYGGSNWLRGSKFTEGERDYNNRVQETREPRPIDPPFLANEEESEELNLIQTPLIDCVKAWTQKFITGQASIEEEWDTYLAECEALGATRVVDQVNEIFEKNKSKLGY